MKIRNGFVSNSSSMSFVIAFPKEIQTREDIRRLIFENINEDFTITDEGDNEVNVSEIVEDIYHKIIEQSPNDQKRALDKLNGFIIVPKDALTFKRKYNTKIFENVLTLDEAQELINEFKNEDKYIYTFTYDDTDYIYQAIAKNLLFINFEHFHIINH